MLLFLLSVVSSVTALLGTVNLNWNLTSFNNSQIISSYGKEQNEIARNISLNDAITYLLKLDDKSSNVTWNNGTFNTIDVAPNVKGVPNKKFIFIRSAIIVVACMISSFVGCQFFYKKRKKNLAEKFRQAKEKYSRSIPSVPPRSTQPWKCEVVQTTTV